MRQAKQRGSREVRIAQATKSDGAAAVGRCIFGGKIDIDLAHVLQTLPDEFGTRRPIVDGRPHVSGSFVNACLVDEVSGLSLPQIDGRGEHPASFEIAKLSQACVRRNPG